VIHKLTDRFLKDVIERHAKEIISAILSQRGFRVLSTQLDKEIIYNAIFAGEPFLMPLVPLLAELVAKPDLTVLYRQHELISAEKDAKRRAEMLLYSVAFGKKHFRSRLVDKIFANLLQENLNMIKEFKAVAETPVIREIIQEEVEKQVQERVEKQVQEQVEKRETFALQEALLDVLAIRFGKENGKVRRMVLAVNNPKKLKVMHRKALKAKSLDPIIASLQKA